MSDTTRALFAPDPANQYAHLTTPELEALGKADHPHADVTAELIRREDVDKAVELWERLCAVSFVRGETQGYYLHSTAYLSPDKADYSGSVHRMPDAVEIEELILSDGEETAFRPHDLRPEYDLTDTEITDAQRAATYYHVDKNEWSHDDRLYPVKLTLISCGDYHGSDLDAANNRALKGTPGVDVREPNTGGMGSVFNVSTVQLGGMTSFANAQGDEPSREDALMWLASLVDTMEGLVEYALIDEEAYSNFVTELADAAWDAWLGSDVQKDIEQHAEAMLTSPYGVTGLGVFDDASDLVSALWEASGNRLPVPTSLDGDDAFRNAYYSFEDNEWTVASLGEGATNGRHAEAVRHACAVAFLIGTCDCYTCTEARDDA